jgi:hypothetical protein
MSIASTLILAADDEAEWLEVEAVIAKRDMLDDDARARMNAATIGRRRVLEYRLMIDGKYQCPRCWIADGKEAIVHIVPRGAQGHDRFRCGECGHQLEDRA